MLFRERPGQTVAPPPASDPCTYSSHGLAEAFAAARRSAPAAALDLGPVHASTVQRLAELRLEVNVAAMEPGGDGTISIPSYPDDSFALILGWDFPARLPADRRQAFADDLTRWLRPGGVLLLILPIASRGVARAQRFKVRGPAELECTPLQSLKAGSVPSTRDVLALFSGLECNGARILRRGSREFVLRRRAGG